MEIEHEGLSSLKLNSSLASQAAAQYTEYSREDESDSLSIEDTKANLTAIPPEVADSLNSFSTEASADQQANVSRRTTVSGVTPRLASRSFLRQRRLRLFKKLALRIGDPERGPGLKNRKKMFKTFPACVAGADLVTWIFHRCKYDVREEAFNTVQTMIYDGFIIPASEDAFKLSENELYCVQTPEYWPTSGVDPTDEEYAIHLLTLNGGISKEHELQDFEIARLEKFKELFAKSWEKMKAVSSKRANDLAKMDKTARKLALIQDTAYWNLYRAKDPKSIPQVDIEAEHKGQHLNEDEFLAGKEPEAVLAFYERRLEMLNDGLNKTRIKTSVAANAMINRCETFARFDPIRTPGLKFNPYVDDPASWLPEDENEVTIYYTKIWQLSFKDLLNDPRGVKRFEQFLKTEFSSENLYFVLECLELEKAPNTERYYHKAKQIYREFIQKHAQKEINIESNIKTVLEKKFESKVPSDVEYGVFNEAVKHITHLMMKDSYPRFLNSKFSAVNVEL